MPSRWVQDTLKSLEVSKFRVSALRVPYPTRGCTHNPGIRIQWRSASTLTSSTAVNASKTIPERYKQLYDALIDVQKRVSASVNLSRLQLALQGLESESLTTRIAVLGLNDSVAARRLVRLLLADSLKPKEPWEDELENSGATQGTLLRYGTSYDSGVVARRGPIPTLHVPSPFLKLQNLEILICPINVSNATSATPEYVPVTSDIFLSPAVEIPVSSSGRQTTLSYPVHKAFVVAEGFDGLLAALRLLSRTSFQSPKDRKLLKNVVDADISVLRDSSEVVTLVNSTEAKSGLEAIRAGIDRAPEFEHGWIESNLSELLSQLSSTRGQNGNHTPEILKLLVESILLEAMSNMQQQANESQRVYSAIAVPDETRAVLRQAIKDFSVRGHTELQSGLASAFSSVNWQKLAWYKLLWRADDVPLIVSDLVERYWLPQSERAVCELTGRLIQSGLHDVSAETSNTRLKNDQATNPIDPQHPFSDLQSTTPAEQISKARKTFIEDSILDLTMKAQAALTKMIAFSTGSTALAALAYFSTPLAGAYECGSVLALGLILAARKLQLDWESSRKRWKDGIFNAGSDILKQVEAQMVRTVEVGGKPAEDEIDVQSQREAKQAVETALQALKGVP